MSLLESSSWDCSFKRTFRWVYYVTVHEIEVDIDPWTDCKIYKVGVNNFNWFFHSMILIKIYSVLHFVTFDCFTFNKIKLSKSIWQTMFDHCITLFCFPVIHQSLEFSVNNNIWLVVLCMFLIVTVVLYQLSITIL